MSFSMNEWINDEAVYRTAPVIPGLLITFTILWQKTKKYDHLGSIDN